ncbi:MAG TPA: NmrA family NAD(P)-binding protein [Polyangiaceae bacterium]|nr:NmrA family NAD(P)-binding protein [Polyangiaceae bacterium]
MKFQPLNTLVLGGTGKTGRRVAQRLRARGLPVRIASRSATPAFDWTARSTWPAALAGVDALYLSYFPDLAAPGAADDLSFLCALARESRVRRIVLLSGRGEPGVLPSERAVQQSGIAFSILRCAFFNQNFSEGHLIPLANGEIAFPAGNVAEPFVDADDIADVAVAALTDDAHDGNTFELTGPRLLTFAEAASELAAASGRPIRYVAVSAEEYGVALRAHVAPEFADFLTELFRNLLDGHNAHLAGDVERVLDRRPRDFRDYALAATQAGAFVPF